LAWAVAALAGAVALSLYQFDQRIGTDFHVFWQAGRDFLDGRPLYQRLPGARSFIYPPFAAMLFQPLALAPLGVAAVGFHAVSLLLVGVVALQTVRIAERTLPGLGRWRWPLALAFLGAFHLVLNNLKLNQVNLLVLALCLGGLLAELRGRSWTAALLLLVPTLIRLTPGIFLVWLLLRGRRRSITAVAVLAPLLLAAPLVQRGPARGMADYREYVEHFLGGFARGRVVPHVTNQALAAAVHRATVPPADPEARSWVLVPLGERAAAAATHAAPVAVLLVLVAALALLARARRPVGAHELAAVFLAMHLASPLTWKAHLASLLFVFFVLLATPLAGIPRGGRWLVRGVGAACVATGFAGRDLVGREMHLRFGGYSLFSWLLLALFGVMLWLALRRPAGPPPAPADGSGWAPAG
jgi:alpha-1,2-mannosyltransferase